MKLNRVEKFIMNSPLRPLKQRREALVMRSLGGEVSGGRALEIGCGRGVGINIIFELFRPSYIEAFDIDPDQVLLAGRTISGRHGDRVKIYEGSALEIASPDGSFDAVFDFGVLHHIPGADRAIGEISRVLKPGGRFFFMEPLASLAANPVVVFLTGHQPELQFTWKELSKRLARAGLDTPGDSFQIGLTRVIGVSCKTGREPGQHLS